jgi:hypothetical protein
VTELLEHYRRNAEKCLQLAQNFNDLEAKRSLLMMANAWLTLAAQREKNINPMPGQESPSPVKPPQPLDDPPKPVPGNNPPEPPIKEPPPVNEPPPTALELSEDRRPNAVLVPAGHRRIGAERIDSDNLRVQRGALPQSQEEHARCLLSGTDVSGHL